MGKVSDTDKSEVCVPACVAWHQRISITLTMTLDDTSENLFNICQSQDDCQTSTNQDSPFHIVHEDKGFNFSCCHAGKMTLCAMNPWEAIKQFLKEEKVGLHFLMAPSILQSAHQII